MTWISCYFNPRSPCGERRPLRLRHGMVGGDFNPRSPCGERPRAPVVQVVTAAFQSTLPVWGATAALLCGRKSRGISIHAPRVGSDLSASASAGARRGISIHAPRVGSDALADFIKDLGIDFNPRSPCGERLCVIKIDEQRVCISIHAPRVGSDEVPCSRPKCRTHFNPRSPCGERPFPENKFFQLLRISIHAPRVGSDCLLASGRLLQIYFNPRSPCGERQQRCTDFSFASSAKRVFFCDILQIGRHLQGIGRKRRGDFLSRSVRTSRGKYGCLAFAFRESGGLRENRRFYSQSVLFSFRIDCQGSRIAGCPFRGP